MDSFPSEKPAPRITVVDSMELEREVFTYLKKEILVDKFIPSTVLNDYESELGALLKFAIWKFSVGMRNATFGQQFQHLKYSSESSKESFKRLAIAEIGGGYLKEKVSNAASRNRNSLVQLLNRYVRYIETIFYILNLLNFISFIRKGGAPTFQENILKLKPVSTVTLSSRIIQHSNMTREFLWNSCIETFLLLIPLINYTSWKRRFEKLFDRPKSVRVETSQSSAYLSSMNCVSCNESAILPYQLGCQHIFCYYCIRSNIAADPGYECPQCGFSNMDTLKSLHPITNG